MAVQEIPLGLCQCGCGRPTKISRVNNTRRNQKKGEYRRFVIGHGLYRKRWETDESLVRTCHDCKKQKPLDMMCARNGVIVRRCKACEVIRVRGWRERNPRKHFGQILRKIHGITVEDYEQMLKKQNGVCAICKRAEFRIDPRTNAPRRLAVDHCHVTNVIRGLLCCDCNRALGTFEDNVERFEAAALYLKEFKGG